MVILPVPDCFVSLILSTSFVMARLTPASTDLWKDLWKDPAVVLIDNQLEQVDKLRKALANCKSVAEKDVICQNIRDELLLNHEKLEVMFAVCLDVMKASENSFTSAEPDASWKQFKHLAKKGAQTRQACINALKDVANRWGPKLIRHYGWGTKGTGYCQQLRAATRKSDWPTFVSKVNPVLLNRHATKSLKSAPIPVDVNPIAWSDLKEVTKQLQQAKVREPDAGEHDAAYMLAKSNSESSHRATNKLPAGLGLDQFGVVVVSEFDKLPERLDSRQNGSPGISVPLTAFSTAHDSSPTPPSHVGFFPETAGPLQLHPSIDTASGNALPFPPSPPSSPDASTSASLLCNAEALSSNGIYSKRTGLGHSDRATKRQRADLSRLNATDPRSATGSPESTRPHSSSASSLCSQRAILGKSRP